MLQSFSVYSFFFLRISELAATFHFPSIQTSKILSHFYTSSFISTSIPSYIHTSTSRGPSCISDATLMSKQVTIITRDLHRLTQYSRSLVTCSSASKYSCDSGSKSWSTSTVQGNNQSLLGGHLKCLDSNVILKCNSNSHSPIHFLGSIISLALVSSSSSFRVPCFILRSLICCCRRSASFSFVLKCSRP